MNLRENLKLVKDELLEQESFLQGAFKVETFYKKNKIIIISSLIIAVGLLIGVNANSYYENSLLQTNTKAFNAFSKDANNKEALETLKINNKNLYDIALFNQAKEHKNIDIATLDLDDSNVWFVKELSNYNNALKNKDSKKLDKLVSKSDFLLKDIAIINKALIQIQNKEYKKAKNTLEFLSEANGNSEIAVIVKHFLIDK